MVMPNSAQRLIVLYSVRSRAPKVALSATFEPPLELPVRHVTSLAKNLETTLGTKLDPCKCHLNLLCRPTEIACPHPPGKKEKEKEKSVPPPAECINLDVFNSCI